MQSVCRCRLGSRQIAHNSPSVRLKHCEHGMHRVLHLADRLGQPHALRRAATPERGGPTAPRFCGRSPGASQTASISLANGRPVGMSLIFVAVASAACIYRPGRFAAPVQPTSRRRSIRSCLRRIPALLRLRVAAPMPELRHHFRQPGKRQLAMSSSPSRPPPLARLVEGLIRRGNQQIFQHFCVGDR